MKISHAIYIPTCISYSVVTHFFNKLFLVKLLVFPSKLVANQVFMSIMSAPPSNSNLRRPVLNGSRTPGLSAYKPVRLFQRGSPPPLKTPPVRPRQGQENSSEYLALAKQVQHLTNVVEALVSNGKVKTELQQAGAPTVPARVQKNPRIVH